MSKYLDTLLKIKNNKWCSNWLPQLEKIEQFVKGNITPQELMQNTDDTMKGIIYYTLNKIINYEEKDIRHYIELPQDMFFNTMNAKCIIAGKLEGININFNEMKTIGPKYIANGWPSFHDNNYIEIDGDFSQFPNGAMLFFSDWFRIISKYPNLAERMHYLTTNDYKFGRKNKNISLEEVQQRVASEIQKYVSAPKDGEPNRFWMGKEEAKYLPQEVIDSISFVIPKEYVTIQQVLNSQFGTFEEILNGPEPLENVEEKDIHNKR